jgi:hypothetical protein
MGDVLFCARCSAELTPGDGNFYVVRIEAVADPTTPPLDGRSAAELRAEIERVLEQLEGVSEREALDQVHRRLVLHLCQPCFSVWIEDPAGQDRP